MKTIRDSIYKTVCDDEILCPLIKNKYSFNCFSKVPVVLT